MSSKSARRKTKKKAPGSISKSLCRLNDIESQIRQIAQMIPQIQDTGKRRALVADIAPVLENALEKFTMDLQKEEEKG